MGRSRNPLNEDGSVGKKRRILPPCRVCSAASAGFHYGANTCEACKAFFHRSIRHHHLYECEGSRTCEVVHTKSQLCKWCRYQRCLDVGMSVNAIKTGRYTKTKKSRDQMELLKMTHKPANAEDAEGSSEMDQDCPVDCTADDEEQAEESQACSRRTSSLSASMNGPECSQTLIDPTTIEEMPGSSAQNGTSSNSCNHTDHDALTSSVHRRLSSHHIPRDGHRKYTKDARRVRYRSSRPRDREPQSLYEDMAFTSEKGNHGHDSNTNSPCRNDSSVREKRYFKIEAEEMTSSRMAWRVPSVAQHDIAEDENDPEQTSSVGAESHTSLSDDSVYPTSPSSMDGLSEKSLTSPELHQGSDLSNHGSHGSPGDDLSNQLVSTVESTGLVSRADHLTISNISRTTDQECMCSIRDSDSCGNKDKESLKIICNVCLSRLYQDKDSVLAALHKARQNFFDPIFNYPPKEEQDKVFTEHLENCKVRARTFGSLRRLPDHEYDQIHASTGIDMDGRQAAFNATLKGIETHVRSIVNFAKHIPGFTYISVPDKINLVKQSRSELVFAGVYTHVDSERRVGKMCNNVIHCETCLLNECPDEKSKKIIMDEAEDHFFVTRTFQELNLTPYEDTLFHAIILMRPDRPITPQDPTVRRIYSLLLECLWVLMQRESPNAEERYSTLIRLLDEARDHADRTLAIYRHLSIRKYSDLSNNPLLLEVLREYF